MIFALLLLMGLPRNTTSKLLKLFQLDASRGLLLAGKWVGQSAEILPEEALKLLSRFARTTALWPLVLVKDRWDAHAMTAER
jgi:hypothetical protein